ncbi:hypothetical protein [Flavobacterium subsaxonicum]|uniref:Uncharacterized protein n=1 Tax=Flavobacterium subsaxonicum WB 4.1-42 = DSM 21790 TaxID=1121898 RepID=A0A0A2MTA8_9FLAO|nr:hypothetical protein [Flavobacterium subsaxonicum]KGO91470.1 hypothetical protein Q766_17985 [Flavobacterium subsaxonicum WB 4.1-42 = DSM 21790]
MKISRTYKVIISTYLFALLLLQLFGIAYFFVFSKIADWEFFAYNFYGSFVLFSLSCIVALFPGRVFKKANIYLGLLLLLIPEPVSLFVAHTSIYGRIFNVQQTGNYFLLAYPLSILLSYTVVYWLNKRSVLV